MIRMSFFPSQDPLQRVKHDTFDIYHTSARGLPLSIMRQYFEGGTDSGMFCHDNFFMLTVIRAGHGTSIIDKRSYNIVRGDVFIISPGMIHGIRDFQGIELDAFYFQTSLFSRPELAALRQLKGFWRLLMQEGNLSPALRENPRLHLSPEQHRVVEEITQVIDREISKPAPLGPLLARQHFFYLLACLAEWHSVRRSGDKNKKIESSASISVVDESSSEAANPYATNIADVIRFCEENFHQPITVPQLAARMFLSSSHFSRIFIAATGSPPAAYLRRLRLERAQRLLSTTSLTVAEIAQQIGMQNSQQLSHAFRDAYATTPRSYRAKFRKRRMR
jgi:AraC-like DNA-binding protein